MLARRLVNWTLMLFGFPDHLHTGEAIKLSSVLKVTQDAVANFEVRGNIKISVMNTLLTGSNTLNGIHFEISNKPCVTAQLCGRNMLVMTPDNSPENDPLW